jgi:hypothetical protein
MQVGGLRAVEATVVVESFAVEEPVDDLEGLLHTANLLGRVWPVHATTTAGLYRYTGAVTPVPTSIRSVARPIAPRSVQAWPECPGSYQGWK